METTKLKSLTVKELSALANKLKIKEHNGLKKQDLIKLILEAESKNKETIFAIKTTKVGFIRPSDFWQKIRAVAIRKAEPRAKIFG